VLPAFTPPGARDNPSAAPRPADTRKKRGKEVTDGSRVLDAARSELRKREWAWSAEAGCGEPDPDPFATEAGMTATGVPISLERQDPDADEEDKKPAGGTPRAPRTRSGHGRAAPSTDPFADPWDTVGAVGVSRKAATDVAGKESGQFITELTDALPSAEESGIFEVVFPDGDRLGVAVSIQRSQVSYLLSPFGEKFGSTLRDDQTRTELERALARRIGKNVKVAVL
jgi:hypothetical protein